MYHPSHLVVHTSYGPVLHRVSQVIDYRLKDGDLVRVDAGAAFKGWTSDICRTAVAGTMSERNRKIYETIRTAQERVIENIRPGVTTSELFRIGQSYVREKGYPAYTRHMIGHSIGLELHEEPLIAPTNSRELQAGMVLAIEIPFYLRDSGGISVEDIVLVTEDGHRMISACTKEP